MIQLDFDVPFDQIGAAHVEPAVEALLASSRRTVEAIVEDSTTRTYASTLGALEDATEQLELAMTVIDHLESVATTDALREAYNATQPKVSAFWSELAMNDGLYQAVRAFAETVEAKSLPPTEARFLKKTLDDFRQHGAELSPGDKAKLKAIEVELTKLTTEFSQNVLDETNAFELLITDEAKLEGLPKTAKLAAAENARAKGLGGWRFTLQAPSTIPLLTYLDDAAIREQVWRAYNTRAVAGNRDNRPIIERVLELRGAKARLLGYADFLDLVTEDRMARTGSEARVFIDDLRERTQAAFDRENDALMEYRRKIEGADANPVQPWDVAYYAEKQRQDEYDFNEEEIRPYFPLDRVLDGLFATAQALYDVRIVEREAATWDDAVKTYAIEDDGTIKVAAVDDKSAQAAIEWIRNIVAEPEVGVIYTGKVVKVVDFGAFVNFLGAKDGLVHISELAEGRTAKVTDVVNEGDMVKVKVLSFDDRGKVKLSMRVVDQETGEDISEQVRQHRAEGR